MERFYEFLKYCDCRASSCKTTKSVSPTPNLSILINHPASLDYIESKTLEDDDDLSPDSTFDTSGKKETAENTENLVKCIQCDSKSNLAILPCGHRLCETCLQLKFSIRLNLSTHSLLRCSCGLTIPVSLLKSLVKPSKLVRYFNETSKVSKIGENCEVCGLNHGGTCLDWYKSTHELKCLNCSRPEEFLLVCGHGYCSHCIKKHAENCLRANFFGVVPCIDCEKPEALIPVWVLNKVFGQFESFIELQPSLKLKKAKNERQSCMICFKKLSFSGYLALECEDKFCKVCIFQYFEKMIQQFTSDCEIYCPKCRLVVDPLIIQGNISPETCESYLEILVKCNKYRKSEKLNLVWCVHSKYTKDGSCQKCFETGKANHDFSRRLSRQVKISVIEIIESPFSLSSSTINADG